MVEVKDGCILEKRATGRLVFYIKLTSANVTDFVDAGSADVSSPCKSGPDIAQLASGSDLPSKRFRIIHMEKSDPV